MSVVLAKVGIVSCDETNDTLLSLVADIDTNKHGFGRDFFAEVHSPKVTAELGVDLSDNVKIDAVVISVDSFAGNKLRDNWVIVIDLVLNSGVEVLLTKGIGYDHKEELDNWL